MALEQPKSYHSDRADALCPGHPEIEHEGIEVTTGPLGQGVANAVRLAMATKNLAATFNKPGFDIVSNYIWCMVGDACLQKGVALEAISFAGHLRLNNLTIIYDNNRITCDGSVDLTNTEDINATISEYHIWVLANEHFIIGDHVRAFLPTYPLVVRPRCKNGTNCWSRMRGDLSGNWKDLIPTSFPETPMATRASSGLVFKPIAEKCRAFMVGTTDLSPSVQYARVWYVGSESGNVGDLGEVVHGRDQKARKTVDMEG
ncbi:hypothetical protein ATEG_03610 [Aspergillus terreus NIH2624]|uniref:Transketolase N-terminal domain-containing protein n=1 Tax=Aspergillus terreus (strain NIH 2624 / FGSC A1156) TaxID=341663 RepID=Q0CRS4_ASPTN|nr:uncharacterized protein ATEG_03610 [Aspergillus terreus NIH2624]EAU35412.1 hypothetical protein ATEG_03610 [Aspergillus terreus NIH2624]